MTKEEKMVDLMKNKKADLVDIIIRKDDTEIALRKDLDGTKKNLDDVKRELSYVSDEKAHLANQLEEADTMISKYKKDVLIITEKYDELVKKACKLESDLNNKDVALGTAEKQLLEDFHILTAARKFSWAMLIGGLVIGLVIGLFC